MHCMKAVAVACYQNVKVQPTILEKVCVITYHDFFKFTLFPVQIGMIVGYLNVQLLGCFSVV